MELNTWSTEEVKVELDLKWLDSVLWEDYLDPDSKSRVTDVCQQIAEILERLKNEEKVSEE